MPESTTYTTHDRESICTLIDRIVHELAPNPAGGEGKHVKLVDELEYTSLALLELAFTLEDEFVLPPIDEETARKIITIADVHEHVLNALSQRSLLAQ